MSECPWSFSWLRAHGLAQIVKARMQEGDRGKLHAAVSAYHNPERQTPKEMSTTRLV